MLRPTNPHRWARAASPAPTTGWRAATCLAGLLALLARDSAQAGGGLQAAISAGEVCLLPPELDARLDAGWDPIALSHAEEAEAWAVASKEAMSLAFLAGASTRPSPGPRPEPESGWAMVLTRTGEAWCAIAGSVWLDGQLPDCEPVVVHASADRLQIEAGSGLCADRSAGVDLRRVSGERFRGAVCGESRELVLSDTFSQRYQAWSARAADGVLKAAIAAGAPELSIQPAVRLNGQAVRCSAATRDCDLHQLVAWCTDATDETEGSATDWLVGPRADGAGYEVVRADGGGRCLYHRVPGVSPQRTPAP